MGYVPIFVALLGLVLLYTIYTYNLIKPRKARLTQVIDEMARNSGVRKNIVLSYDRENEGSSLSEVAGMLKKTSTDRFQSYRKEEELMSAIENGANGLSDQKVSDELLETNKTQQELIKKLQSVSNEYNAFIKKAPASMVASLFGFRPF
ncbi:hypothetical protein BFP97_01910 [Roseivirga sp. 4D4]|uniref:hypothetical protein n=1 Tax=Roseivirga sp. 4D4 TaxID=1889784 RepID=UPI0008536FC5|nr:hypothetical protein [Roseivirga sp. 4D4]OEK00342.1 hypothetical protein BFP97_01910 [Roseivirga sp. 4D4]